MTTYGPTGGMRRRQLKNAVSWGEQKEGSVELNTDNMAKDIGNMIVVATDRLKERYTNIENSVPTKEEVASLSECWNETKNSRGMSRAPIPKRQ
jgi:hypothetical protein